ncbi:apolipophorins isoform X2 [Culicoides brevitarsis]|uniref:apolipophorins isoform X2 n=1 Tax=Culicoides brevitarsis TaxID=469753 RepID=UPI00307C44F9
MSTIFLLFLVFGSSFAAVCKEGCPVANQLSKYKFEQGKAYTYNVDSQVTVFLTGGKQQTQLKVNGVAQLYYSGNCQYTLFMQKVQLTSPDDKKVAVSKDLQKPVKFVLSNDELLPEVCADSSDSEFSVNVKRAIISLIQSVEQKSYETDVFGVCPTNTVVNTLGDSTVITKTRDLNTCAHRESLADGFIKSVFNEASGIKSTPVLNGDYLLEQKIKAGVLDSAVLTENYVYLPFSGQNTGARAKVVTKLSFTKSEAKEAPQPQNPAERSLLFKADKGVPTSNPDNLRAVLKKTVESFDETSKAVGKESATTFAELVRALRAAKKGDVALLYDDIKKGSLKLDKELARKVYLDALFRAGSAHSITFIAEILKKELSEKEQRLAYLSFNLAQTVSHASIFTVAKTLGPQSIREAYMGVGTLVKKFCESHTCTDKDLKDIFQKYANNLGSCKATSRQQEDKFVAVLKAVRNTGVMFEPVQSKLLTCIADGPSARVRVAALQAIGATTCSKVFYGKLLELLKNRSLDSEVRIEAYLALVKCPTSTLANEVKALLDDEPIYQVGSFISSHLMNIRASADPHREQLRRVLGNVRPSQRFPSDVRKYSFNRELSYAVDSLGLGASVDSNVIYSQKGFLPRSGTFNLTGELFGNVFNVFDVNVRQENLEQVFEHFFGPKGELKSSNFQELFNNALTTYNSVLEGTKKRFRRGVARDEVDGFKNGLTYQNEVFSDVELDLSVKLFGTEMYFLSLANEVPSSPKEFVNALFKALDKNIKDAKNFNKVYENHVLFLDVDLVYPSGVGLPLKLGLQGAAAARVEMGVATDVKQWKKAPKFSVTFVPSFNVDVSGTFVVDAQTLQAGLKLEGNLHSSTGSTLDFALSEDKKTFDLKVSFPFKNQELVSFKTNALFVVHDVQHGDVAIPVTAESTKNRMHFSDCFDQFFPLIGINVCPSYDLNIGDGPNTLSFPFAGPNYVALKLELEKEFTLKGQYDDSKPKQKLMTYTFDTPGSAEKRETKLELEVGYNVDYFVRVALTNPRKSASAEAGLKRNNKEFALYAKAKNDFNEYLAQFGFDVKGNEARAEYTPVIIFKTPKDGSNDVNGYKVDGKIVVEQKDGNVKFTFNNVKLTTPTNTPYVINGFVDQTGQKVTYDVNVVEDTGAKRKASLTGAFEYQHKEKFLLDVASTNDFVEVFNGQVKYELNRKEGSLLSNDFLVVYGKDYKTSKNKVHLYQYAAYTKDGTKKLTTLDSEFKLDVPVVPFLFAFKHSFKPNFANFNLDFQTDPHKLNVYSNNKYNMKTKGDFDVELGGSFNKHNAKFTGSRVVGEKLSDVKYDFVSSCGFNFGLNGKFGKSASLDNLHADFEAKATLPNKKDTPYSLKFFLETTKTDFKSTANVLEGAKTLATYSADGKRGDVKEGKFDLDVTEVLTGNGNFKSDKGKGSLTTLFVFKKIDRKVKVESEFNVAQPTYDVNTKFFYDFEKDNNKKIEFTTKSNLASNDLSSKNTLLVLTEKYTFNVAGKSEGTKVNGNLNGEFELGLPTGRKVSGHFDRHRDMKDEKGNGKLKVSLADELPNGNKRSVSLDTVVKDADFKHKFFDMSHKLYYVGFDKKEATLTNTVSRFPGSGTTKTNVGVKLDGTLLPNPVTFTYASDETSQDKADYHVTGKYGSQFDFDVVSNYDVNRDHTKPTLTNMKFVVNVPDTKLKQVVFEHSCSVKTPEAEDGLYEGKHSNSLKVSDKTLAFDVSYKANQKTGDLKAVFNLPETDPVNVKLSYNREKDATDARKAHVDFEVLYQKDKKVHLVTDSTFGANDVAVKASLQSPAEKAKDVKLDFAWNVSGGNKYSTALKVDVDSKAYAYNGVVVLSEVSPSVLVEFVHPDKTTKLHLGVQKLEDSKYVLQVEFVNVLDYNLDLKAEAFFKSHDNFYLTVNSDSTKYKQVVVKINSKQGGKGVEFVGTKEGKNVLSGSAEFQVKEDKGKTIIEGTGNVKLYEDQQATTFKFIRNKFEATKDGETGVSFVFDGRIGTKNIISELKLTDKNVAFKHTVCEAKKQCVNVDLRSTIQKTEFNDFKHELLISVDLRELGYSHEFGLKADTSKVGMVIDHTVDMHLQSQDQNKYQYSLYVHKNSAGIVLTLPARTIALESTYNYPSDQLFGKYDAGVAFYLDKKNNPSGKTSLTYIGSVDRTGTNVVKGKSELRLDHPSMKSLSVSGFTLLDADNQRAQAKVTFDVFQQEANKVVVQANYENADKSGKGFNVTSDVKVSSKGLKLETGFDGHAALNYDTRVFSFGANAVCPTKDFGFGSYLFVSEKVFELYGRVFNEEVLKVAANYDLEKRSATYNSVFKQLGMTPVVVTGQVDGLTTASFSLSKDKVLDVKGQFDLGKEASVTVSGNGKGLFNGKVALDDGHFLATNFEVQEEEIKTFLDQLQTTTKSENDAARQAYAAKFENLKTTVTGQFKALQSSFPDFGKMKGDYLSQWDKFQAELQADPTIKKIADFLTQTAAAVTKFVDEVTTTFLGYYEKVSKLVSDFYLQVEEAFNTKFLPMFKELYTQVEAFVYKLYEEFVSLVGGVFERVAKALKGFQTDFNKMSLAMADLFKNVSAYFKEYVQQFEKEVRDVWELFLQQLQALPGLEMVKTKVEEFFAQHAVGEQVAALLNELLDLAREHLPTEESKAFVKKLSDYLTAKLLKQPVNDTQSVKELFELYVKAVRSLFKFVSNLRKDKDVSGWMNNLPVSFESFKRVSYIWNVKFSPLNCLREGGCFSLRNLLSYRPYGFQFTELFPPFTFHGHIGDGEHIFTFDGRHLTFPGSCNYVLVQDAFENNFTLVANLVDGKMNSLTLFDKGDSIEVTKDGVVNLNGAPTELPAHHGDLAIWRRYYSVSVATTYGLHLLCSTDLRVCHVTVNGFYHGRLRGLLGNGNHEPYDDFVLPSGEVTEDDATFGNAYGLGTCKPVAKLTHEHESDELCNSLFGGGSNLRLCYFMVPHKNYKDACAHAVKKAADKKDAACNMALLYASTCKLEHIPIQVPEQCAKCKVDGKDVELGDDFDMKLPQKQADVVLVVDTTVKPELVNGLVGDLRKEFAARQINDVHVALVGYNYDEKYIYHFTTKGGLDFTGTYPNVPMNEFPKYQKPVVTGDERVDKFTANLFKITKQLQADLGFSPAGRAVKEALDYPFRPAAVKHVLVVRGSGLDNVSPAGFSAMSAIQGVAALQGVSMHALLPLDDLTVGGGADAKKVVGFSKHSVFQLGDGRKRPEGTPELRSELSYEHDKLFDTVMQENGMVFALQNYEALDAKQKRGFTVTLAAAVADLTSRTEQKLECVCVLKHSLFPEQLCHVVEENVMPPSYKVAARG